MNVATKPQSSAGVREVKNRLSEYLQRVRDGEEIVITDRGRPIARLTSIGADVDRLQLLVEQGLVRRSTAPRSAPRRRPRLDGSVAALVDEQRR